MQKKYILALDSGTVKSSLWHPILALHHTSSEEKCPAGKKGDRFPLTGEFFL